MTKIEKYTQEAIDIANDNRHGYSMTNRDGNPDYDCSSLVCAVVDRAGIPVKSYGASYTGNMLNAFLACGFKNVTSSCGLSNGRNMVRGDILLNTASHAAIYIGDGKLVHARSSEGNSIPGDQNGAEIRVQNYFNYPWSHILRYYEEDNLSHEDSEIVFAPGGTVSESGLFIEGEEGAYDIALPSPDIDYMTAAAGRNNINYPAIIKYGDIGEEVRLLQEHLNELGYDCGEADGDFGILTLTAVKKFQRDHMLLDDGEVGPDTKGAMNKKETSTLNKVGDNIFFKGSRYYLGTNSDYGFKCDSGLAKIVDYNAAGKHPFYLIAIPKNGSDVFGWVNAEDIGGIVIW